MDYIVKSIADGVSMINVPVGRFKTNEIAVRIALPINEDTASVNALVIGMLSRKCKDYPDISSFNVKLAALYGAQVESTVSKLGECQVLTLGMTSLDDRFSLDGESISLECVRLLMSLLFEPCLDENGFFEEQSVEAEKRILIQKLEAEDNEKRVYALRRAEEIMFAGEPYGINRYGTVEQIKAITSKAATAAWKNMLDTGKILVSVVGNIDIERTSELVSEHIGKISRSCVDIPPSVFVPSSDEVKTHTERIDVKQGKLVLGFRVNMKPDDEDAPAMRTFCDVFGGGPYSKLFANVREKLSLCYYCSARYTRLKSCIMVQCGCNEENMDKAVSEILAQLEEIKNGNCDEELASSKMGLRDAILSVNDTPELIENWYSTQILEDEFKTPEQSVAEGEAVTKQQIQHCAELLTLDTVYKLTAKEDEE